MLENCMARFGEDQRRIAETMRRLELGISRPTPEPQPEESEPTRPQHASSSGQHRSTPESPPADSAQQRTHTHATNNTEYGAECPAAREPPSADNRRVDRNVTFDNASYSSPHTTAHPPTYMTQSTLIPYDEVRTVRYSLPEFHGTAPEDPVRFIHKAESTLYKTHIDRAGWTSIIEPQLKGLGCS
ncbi:Uncharacterized protein FWK35_00024916 [Aphis craccivora]|uniref:Uncharacterized protein n=1 Tax=Aphis craccivora TaxID=307492 RepID=A0A6G0Y2V6_APHCR|nr:Uncharacterized protein FWK35_00024916 [Aphis craccivora]